ncbi:hypothetical protein FFLO_01722 [Filobasidium floriforme]|uniref:Alkyl transferase n=1 Tax=Filobasidium floriforme TaxID=5210 RepID=A0A8K0NPT8_9TREE|nr:Decaprenyl diphosphate synthase-like protein [Filobasidium floriforme]KAG7562893.1 hypothetical protein FFLO_01722 [Filobasidium floriforme]KAH8086414.1 Decaprenyl diphosphate synthase-like protein [Filobasidium floriforme]
MHTFKIFSGLSATLSDLLNSLSSYATSRLTRLLLSILSCGPIPRHIAIVMDGNRRYARERGLRVGRGHEAGFESLKGILEQCLRLNIRCVSVYAFSIENFTRPQEEIDDIMHLAKTNLKRLSEEGELLHRYDVRVNVLGRRSLLPLEIQQSMQELEESTSSHRSSILNVCCPYTSRDEVTTAIRSAVSDARAGLIQTDEITSDVLFSNLSTQKSGSPPLDILIRTSDVKRLSDFMMWQCSSNTSLEFVKTFWPEFGIRDMVPILLAYQRKVVLSRID